MQRSTQPILRRFPSRRWFDAAVRKGVRVHFKCPSCSGSSFGSGRDAPGKELIRNCHGNDAGNGRQGCRFAWHERDDHKHFYVEG